MALKMHSSLAVHVGDWIKTELLEPQNVRINTVAEHLGVSRQAISALLNGRCGLTAEMAIRFEKAFGVRAETLMRMQSTFDLAQARAHTSNLCIRHFGLMEMSETSIRQIRCRKKRSPVQKATTS